METNPTYAASLDDMIFEGRNKAYGAYVLRRIYHQHLSRAILYAIGLFLAGFLIPLVGNLLRDHPPLSAAPKKAGPVRMISVVLPPPVEPVEPVKATPPAGAPKPAGPTVRNTTLKVVEDTKPVTDQVPTQEELATAASGLTTSPGDGSSAPDLTAPGSGPGLGTEEGEGAAPAKVEPFISVEHMPQFEGGLPQLMAFIGKHLRYPKAAQQHGVEGTVVVSFVVAATGEVTDVQVLKGLGYGTEEEALKVIQKLPRWKPGNQNGRAVPVRMTLPIRLELK
ncbi:energy transducer TonB [Rufibacter psychrotolerans]|uniref:energy transducer TonB n=1 Tax=Rufibacter psychrotolerans TaxID=2812556 RepID=UPI001967DF6E|nr:energy transducer TonB [Rufibacter sp. SYSU D00308]